ncbi:MAG: glycosyltransferase family 4 protein [Bacillota bacterium]
MDDNLEHKEYQRLYLINQHYYPELASTGQIFKEIAEFLVDDYTVIVVSGLPFYHDGKIPIKSKEVINKVSVVRLWNTRFSKKRPMGKLLNILTFQISLCLYVLFVIKENSLVMIGTNPPMAVSIIAFLKRFKKLKFVYVIHDLYPDILRASKMLKDTSLFYKLLKKMQYHAMLKADRIVVISEDMRLRLKKEYGIKKVLTAYNWAIGDIYPTNKEKQKIFLVLYSGNLGIAHDIHTISGAIMRLKDNDDILFKFVGGGVNFDRLKRICENERLSNAVFQPYLPEDELNESLNAADISLVLFNGRFNGILLPSKYYGILASGKPVLLITDGQNDFTRDVERYDVGYIIKTGEAALLADLILRLPGNRKELAEKGMNARRLYLAKYKKETALQSYTKIIAEMSHKG